MRNSKIDNVINLTASERYDYFIRKVADFEEVWGLKDAEGWALMGSEEQVLFPIWSEKEFAELCKWDSLNKWVHILFVSFRYTHFPHRSDRLFHLHF